MRFIQGGQPGSSSAKTRSTTPASPVVVTPGGEARLLAGLAPLATPSWLASIFAAPPAQSAFFGGVCGALSKNPTIPTIPTSSTFTGAGLSKNFGDWVKNERPDQAATKPPVPPVRISGEAKPAVALKTPAVLKTAVPRKAEERETGNDGLSSAAHPFIATAGSDRIAWSWFQPGLKWRDSRSSRSSVRQC
jgi:hypothetical protein